VGSWQGTLNLTWHIIPILITYPIWGTIQQFLIIGLFTGNLQHQTKIKLSNTLNIAITTVYLPLFISLTNGDVGHIFPRHHLFQVIFERKKSLCIGHTSRMDGCFVLLHHSQSRSFFRSFWEISLKVGCWMMDDG
jgi:hypothetical protein